MAYEILNEVYFGKTKSILKIKQAFDELYVYVRENNTPPYREKCYTDLCKLIEKQWGFKSFRLLLDGRNIDNAYTFPVSTTLKNYKSITDLFILTKDNLSLNPKYKLSTYVCLYRGEFINTSADEAFGVLLHEIGHSFQGVVNQTLSRTVAGIKNTVADMTLRQQYRKIIEDNITDIDGIIKDDKEFQDASEKYEKQIKGMPRELGLFFKAISSAIHIAMLPLQFVATALGFASMYFGSKAFTDTSKHVNKFDHLGNEYFSDSFAAMYGYGSAVSSNLLNSENRYFERKGIISTVYSVLNIPDYFVVFSHPNTIARAMSVLSHYEFELTNNKDILSAEDIREIKAQIEELRAMIKKNTENAKQIENLSYGRKLYGKIFAKFYYAVFKKNLEESDYNFGMKL